ncbi:MAG: DUF3365 domain-containing protein [Saprospiraceae bacterium]|nr:DUF3365 domain-containing protein [Saprospiraceae bacterium]
MHKLNFVFFILLGILLLSNCKSDQNKALTLEKSSEIERHYLERGSKVSFATFSLLSKELQNAFKVGGIEHALSYCNVNALPLTAQIANQENVNIKRTSEKYRNPKNSPSMAEAEILEEYDQLKRENMKLDSKVVSSKDGYTFYSPIIVQDMCLKCHGAKETIPAYNKVLDLYPNDKAHGYNQGDLRGMWSIHFPIAKLKE